MAPTVARNRPHTHAPCFSVRVMAAGPARVSRFPTGINAWATSVRTPAGAVAAGGNARVDGLMATTGAEPDDSPALPLAALAAPDGRAGDAGALPVAPIGVRAAPEATAAAVVSPDTTATVNPAHDMHASSMLA